MKKGKKNAVLEVVPLQEDERLLSVSFHAQLPADVDMAASVQEELQRLLLHLNINGGDLFISIAEAVSAAQNIAAAAPTGLASSTANTAHSPPPRRDPAHFFVPLLEQRVLTELSALEALMDGERADMAAIYAPPPPLPLPAADAADENAASGGSKLKRAKQSAHAASVAAANARVNSADKQKLLKAQKEDVLSRGECLGRVPLSLIDLAHDRVARYTLPLSSSSSELVACTKCWIEIQCADSPLLPVELVSKYRPAFITVHSIENIPSEGATSQLKVVVRCFGKEVARLMAPPSAKPLPFRAVMFLGSSNPLQAYRQASLEIVTVTVHRRDDEGWMGIGSGSFSLRGFVTDAQTFQNESVQLLPSRTTLPARETCLTSGCTVSVSIDTLVPLPRPVHVNDVGSTVGRGMLLTRAVLVIPYAASWSERAVSTLLRELKQLPRAREDVHIYSEPEPEPLEEETEEAPSNPVSRTSRVKRGGTAASSGGAKGKKTSATLPPPPPPKPPMEFEKPFTLVSPAGISGFEVMDGKVRVVCLEGLVSEVHRVVEGVMRAADCDPRLRVLLNSEQFYPCRFYLSFPPLVTPPAGWKPTSSAAPAEGEPNSTVAAASDAGTEETEMAEAGGTGGRIHRIRLRETLDNLMGQQHHLLRRALSDACLSCFQCLHALSRCDTLRVACERGLFPSAADLISLERSFGQTLDLFDIFGQGRYVDLGESEPFSARSNAAEMQWQSEATTQDIVAGDIDAANLRSSDVGRLVSFQGVLASSTANRGIPHTVMQRFTCALWMAKNEDQLVLCAFPRSTPGGTIHYHVEGQVVQCGGMLLLYVLDFHSLVKGAVNSRNPRYEEHRKRRKRLEYEFAAWLAGTGGGTKGTATSAVSSPTTSSPMGQRQLRQSCGIGVGQLEESSDDDAHNPPIAEADDAALEIAQNVKCYETLFQSRCMAGQGTRTSRMQAALAASRRRKAKEQEPDAALLWRMYNERAPKDTVAAERTAPSAIR